MYKGIIFDFDYTLGDSTKGIILSVNYALEKLGFLPLEEEQIKKTIGLSLKDTFITLTGSGDVNLINLFPQYFKEKADQVMVDNTTFYEGVLDTLEMLKKDGYIIGIVTTKFHSRIEQILKKYDATHLVDLIVGGDDVKIEKPDPEGLLWAIDHMQIKKENVLYVGDSIVDAKTAMCAGVDFVGTLTGTTTRDELEEYPYKNIVNQISEIITLI